MNRAIFLREFRVGLRQEVVLAGLVLGWVATFVWVVGVAHQPPIIEPREKLSLFLAVSISFMAFSSGARTFTAESRRRQELFLCILPISRTSLWLSMVGGRLAAALVVGALLFLIRFSLPGDSPDLPGFAVGILTLYPALFASGCCFPLLFRLNTPPYVAWFFMIFVVLIPIMMSNPISPFSVLSWLLWIFSVGLLSVALLLLSWFFFQRGESQARPRQLINLMLLGATLATSLLVIVIVAVSPLLDGVAGPWTQDLPHLDISSLPLVSSGGRYLAVIETLRARPEVSRVTIVETATGRRIGMHRWRGLVQVSWSAQNEVLRILYRDSEFPFFKDGEWIWLTPEGRELVRHSLEPIQGPLPLRDGSDLLIDESSRGRLVRWGNTKDVHVLAEIPEARSLYLWGSQGALVTQNSSSTTWVVRQVSGGTVQAAVGLELFLEPYLSFLREIEEKSGQKLLKTSSKDHFLERPTFGGVSLPDKLALYLTTGGSGARAHLYDGSLGREIPLPACPDGPATTPELIPTRNSPAFLIRYQCRHVGASGQAPQIRHFYYLPGSGSPKTLPALDQVLDGRPILLAWLDEQTAIWRPEKGETWKIFQHGRVRTLWPPRSGE